MIPNHDIYKQQIDEELYLLLRSYSINDPLLYQALEYAVILGGKRLRAILTLLSAQLFNVPYSQAIKVAAAIELCHCYSLVHDDLPSMDNSSLRRGQQSCWKKYGEVTALLVGDALIPIAYETLVQLKEEGCSPEKCLTLIQRLSYAIGPHGMVGGQKLDMNPQSSWGLNDIITMQTLKTGELIAFSCEAGAILAGQAVETQTILREYGLALGLIYQIIDDLLDYKSTPDQLGKPTQQDDNKKTLVTFLGQERSYQYAQELGQKAADYLSVFPVSGRLPFLNLLEYTLNRVSI